MKYSKKGGGGILLHLLLLCFCLHLLPASSMSMCLSAVQGEYVSRVQGFSFECARHKPIFNLLMEKRHQGSEHMSLCSSTEGSGAIVQQPIHVYEEFHLALVNNSNNHKRSISSNFTPSKFACSHPFTSPHSSLSLSMNNSIEKVQRVGLWVNQVESCKF